MKLEDIKPKYIVLNQSYDDFAQDTEEINYKEEDYLSQVLDITSVLYTNSLETIWGLLGFTWDVYNDYGHFNTISMPFSTIPKIPDGERIKQFKENMFSLITSRDIEIIDSNFINLETVENIVHNNKRFKITLFNTKVERFCNNANNATSDEAEANKGSSLELYTEDDKNITYLKQNDSSNGLSYYIINNNTKTVYHTISKDYIRATIRNETNEVFDIYQQIKFVNKDTNYKSLYYQAKSNKFILPIIYPSGLDNSITLIPYYDYKNSTNEKNKIKILNLNNLLEVTIKDYYGLDLNTQTDYISIPQVVGSYLKKLEFDIDVDSYLAITNTKLEVYLLSNLVVLPEVGNVEWFKNSTFETILDIERETDKSDILFNYLFISYNDSNITFDLRHSKVSFDRIKFLTKESAFIYDFPFKFINSENAILGSDITLNKYDIDDNGDITCTLYNVERIFKNPIRFRRINSSYHVHAGFEEPILSAEFIFMNYNPYVLFQFDSNNLNKQFVAPYKCIINTENERQVFQLFYNYNINIDGSYKGYESFKTLYDAGIVLPNAAIIENPNNYQFTTNDYLMIGCFFNNSSGANVNQFKNNKIQYNGYQYLVNPKDKEYSFNSTNQYVHTDIVNWDMFYNFSINIICIQTNIHNFVDAIVDEKIPENVTRTITIIHENYVELTNEEKEKIINLGYTLTDLIA